MWHRRPRSAASPRYLRQFSVRHYPLSHLSMREDGGDGWNVRVYPPSGKDAWEMQCSVPDGLNELLAEARQRIDRRLDGEAWPQNP